jgi:hypothetical protein
MNELIEDLDHELNSPRYLSDAELIQRARDMMVRKGYTEAETCSDREFTRLLIKWFNDRGETPLPPGWSPWK